MDRNQSTNFSIKEFFSQPLTFDPQEIIDSGLGAFDFFISAARAQLAAIKHSCLVYTMAKYGQGALRYPNDL